jgi:NADH-quinone oxidoreductase subunit K
MIVPFGHVLFLAAILFTMGAICAAARRNLIMILIGIEIMFNAAGLAFVGAALAWGTLDGQVFVIFIIGAAAAEAGVGLVLFNYLNRRTGSANADSYNALKG